MATTVDSPIHAFVKKAKEAERRLRDLSQASEELGPGPAYEAIELAPAVRAAHQNLSSAANMVLAALDRVATELHRNAAREADTYAARLTDAFRAAGLEPVGDPSRPVIQGRVYLELDPSRPAVRLNGRALADLRPSAVVRETKNVLAAIKAKAAAPADFLGAVKRVYERLLSERNAPVGTQVHVSDVHVAMLMARQSIAFRRDPRAANFSEYPLELFRSELYEALLEQTAIPGGGVLHVESGADTKGAIFMLIPALGRLGHAGRLWIEVSKI